MKIPNIVMRAYYGMPEKTAEDFRNLKLHTGDLGGWTPRATSTSWTG